MDGGSRIPHRLGRGTARRAAIFPASDLHDLPGSSQQSDLAEAASRDTRIAGARDRLEDIVPRLAAAVRPRSEYGLIHGELGPGHVLVDRLGQPVLIDIEGLMFFDAGWEHAFLRIRFGEHYQWLDTRNLDEQRLAFYTLAMRLSLVAGPLRLPRRAIHSPRGCEAPR